MALKNHFMRKKNVKIITLVTICPESLHIPNIFRRDHIIIGPKLVNPAFSNLDIKSHVIMLNCG